MKKKALFVVTSHSQLGNTDKKTGYYLSELTHPYFQLMNDGFEVDIMSPRGGKAPVDEKSVDLSDSDNRKFLEDKYSVSKVENTLAPDQVSPHDYSVIFFPGGHGPMWDLPNDQRIQKIVASIYDHGGIVAAVCHGPAGLVNVRTKDGKFLVAGKRINSFTDEEERGTKLEGVVPFLLESKLKERGAIFEKSPPGQEKVVIDGRLITGQNPASARGVGRAIAQSFEMLAAA